MRKHFSIISVCLIGAMLTLSSAGAEQEILAKDGPRSQTKLICKRYGMAGRRSIPHRKLSFMPPVRTRFMTNRRSSTTAGRSFNRAWLRF